MNPDAAARLRALAEAATPGPWEVLRDGDYDEMQERSYDWPWRIPGVCSFAEEDVAPGHVEANPPLIVELRNAAVEIADLIQAAEAFGEESCPDCGGTRIVPDGDCEWCNGTGLLFREVSDEEHHHLLDALAALKARLGEPV